MAKRILVVEDDTFLREMYQELLTDEGYDVDVGADGGEGFEKLMANEYDLALLDIMMPKKDGLQILRDIPENKRPCPFVMLTNLGQDQVIKDALALGAAGYLIKSSLAPDEVVQKIEEFLQEG